MITKDILNAIKELLSAKQEMFAKLDEIATILEGIRDKIPRRQALTPGCSCQAKEK